MIHNRTLISRVSSSNNFNQLDQEHLSKHYDKYKNVLSELTSINKSKDLQVLGESTLKGNTVRVTNWRECFQINRELTENEDANVRQLITSTQNDYEAVVFIKHPSFNKTHTILGKDNLSEVQTLVKNSVESKDTAWVYHPEFCTLKELFIDKFTTHNLAVIDKMIYLSGVSNLIVAYGTEYHFVYAVGVKCTIGIMAKLHQNGQCEELFKLVKECALSKEPTDTLPKFKKYVIDNRGLFVGAGLGAITVLFVKAFGNTIVQGVGDTIVNLSSPNPYQFTGIPGHLIDGTIDFLKKCGYNCNKLLTAFWSGVIRGYIDNAREILDGAKNLLKDVKKD